MVLNNVLFIKMTLLNFLILNISLFVIGIFDIIINRKNLLILLMVIELMLLAINLNFICSSSYLDDMIGQISAFFILTIATADVLLSLGVKLYACPGRLNQVSLFFKRKGLFYSQCSEICGVNHGFMSIELYKVSL